MPKIRRPWERKQKTFPQSLVHGVANGQLDDLENEKQVDLQDDPSHNLVSLTKADKRNYEDTLKTIQQSSAGKKYELVPIWTMEDADGKPKGSISESPETQGRFRKYAEQGIPAVVIVSFSPLAIVTLRPVDRNRRPTGNYMVERLCQIESNVCPENHRDLSAWRYQYDSNQIV